MKILVASCDNHADTLLPFHECLERFYPTHPPVVYSTETVTNPYYPTISKNYPIQQWTRRIRETLEDLLSVDRTLWKQECAGIREFYAKFGDKLPRRLREELEGLEARLNG